MLHIYIYIVTKWCRIYWCKLGSNCLDN